MIHVKNFFATTAALTFTAVLLAANAGPPAAVPSARMNVNLESMYMSASIVILKNEILNNQEEEYIILGANSDYFTGFNDGMSDAIAQLQSFSYTVNQSADIAALTSNLSQEQSSADDVGTSYGTGMGTAYQYAVKVLNRATLSANVAANSSSASAAAPMSPNSSSARRARPERTEYR
jgi:hypothetical protein